MHSVRPVALPRRVAGVLAGSRPYGSAESVGVGLGLCLLGHQNWEHWAFGTVLARGCFGSIWAVRKVRFIKYF